VISPHPSYDVRLWSIRRYKGKRGTTYTVRWAVGGNPHQRTFTTHKLAEAFRADLLVAARDGVPFGLDDGLPQALKADEPVRTWLDHAMEYVSIKWPGASPRHRRGIAEALTDITMALLPEEKAPVDTGKLRRALYRYAFNVSARTGPVPEQVESVMAWLKRHSPALADLNDAVVLRGLLNRLALRQDGKPAAASTVTRKRATLHSVLQYAVELELFPTNPLKRVRWKAPTPTDVVDRRIVVNPAQARALLEAVWEQDPALAAFFACLYYAGLRPAEARNLRLDDCTLPDTGWGRLLLTSSHQTSGSAWTDEATSGEDRGSSTVDVRTSASSQPTPNWSRRSAVTSTSSSLAGTGDCSLPGPARQASPSHRPTTTRSRWAPSTAPGTRPGRQPSTSDRWSRCSPADRTTCGTPASRRGSTPESLPPRSRNGPATASRSSSACTPSASTATTRLPCAGSRRPPHDGLPGAFGGTTAKTSPRIPHRSP
jgi:hypothetical protein